MWINNKEYTAEELQKIANGCFDRTSFAIMLGWLYYNGKVSKKIDEIVKVTGISIDHFDAFKKNKERRKYPIIKKNCPVCNKEFESQTGSKEERITCSYHCANIYFADSKHTDIANKKRSDSLHKFNELNGTRQHVLHLNCLWCQTSFDTIKKDQACCSNKCAAKYRATRPEYIAKLSAAAQQRVNGGTHNGWASRTKLKPSFPEQIVIEILKELNISLERELKAGKWFIDFADATRKIAIEIDGGQHKLPERKASDANKDSYLISQGWQVHRIPWKKLTKESREELKKKLKDILTGTGV